MFLRIVDSVDGKQRQLLMFGCFFFILISWRLKVLLRKTSLLTCWSLEQLGVREFSWLWCRRYLRGGQDNLLIFLSLLELLFDGRNVWHKVYVFLKYIYVYVCTYTWTYIHTIYICIHIIFSFNCCLANSAHFK